MRYVIGIVVALCIHVQGVRAQDDVQTLEGFKLPEYSEEGRVKSILTGDLAEFFPDGDIRVSKFKINFFAEDGRIEMRIVSPVCTFNQQTRQGRSDGAITIERDNMVVTGKKFTWSSADEHVEILSNAKVVLGNMKHDMKIGDEQ